MDSGIVKNRADRIIECHRGISGSMKQAVDYALEAGQLLTEQKAELKHGDFLPWIKAYMPFGQSAAFNYIKIYTHAAKLHGCGTLQEAYKQIEQIEREQNKTEKQKAYTRVKEYNKTGEKPEGWRRGTDDKLAEEEKDRDVRIQKFKDKMDTETARREQIGQDRQTRKESIDDLIKAVENQEKEKTEFRKKVGLTGDNAFHDFNDLLMRYLKNLNSNGLKIEACHNIIKICKGVVTSLQQEAVRGEHLNGGA